MYHPSRGGVRGGRDQFKWDDVKVDKHRENYVGHSIKAPVGRWQKGKDLFWYTRDKNQGMDQDSLKAEIQKVKDEEEQLMREALGLAPKRSDWPPGNRLDKHEFSELVKRGSTAEDLGGGHAEAAHVHGLGFSRGSHSREALTYVQPSAGDVSAEPAEGATDSVARRVHKEESEDEVGRRKKRKHDDRKREKREERKQDKHEMKQRWSSRDSNDKRSRRKNDRKRDRD